MRLSMATVVISIVAPLGGACGGGTGPAIAAGAAPTIDDVTFVPGSDWQMTPGVSASDKLLVQNRTRACFGQVQRPDLPAFVASAARAAGLGELDLLDIEQSTDADGQEVYYLGRAAGSPAALCVTVDPAQGITRATAWLARCSEPVVVTGYCTAGASFDPRDPWEELLRHLTCTTAQRAQ